MDFEKYHVCDKNQAVLGIQEHTEIYEAIKAQNPKLDIRIVFQNENQKIRKGSKTSYADFCRKHEIMFASKEIPEDWLR